jgi:uncharacterized protein YhfF
VTEIPARVKGFWRDFLAKTSRSQATPVYEVSHFADSEEDANALGELVLRGEKTATASLLWEYDAEERRPPQRGDLSIVTSWDGRPLCIIETTDVTLEVFEDVDAGFAAAEGEDDRSLQSWRESHWRYFGRVCRRLGREPSPRMQVVCERFRVVFIGSGDEERS